jgi:hypothetical protein
MLKVSHLAPLSLLGALLGTAACDDGSPSDPVPDAARPDGGGLDARAPDGGQESDAGGDAGPGRQKVTLRFKGKVGDQELECGRDYPKLGSSEITAAVRDFRFFVQDVRLVTRAGDEVPLQLDDSLPFQSRDVALIDFTNYLGACEQQGDETTNLQITGSVPVGDYTGLVFTNGVPEALNHADPGQSPELLKARQAHWSWVGGYRFVIAGLMPALHAPADGGAHPLPPLGDAGLDGGLDASVHDGGAHEAGAHEPPDHGDPAGATEVHIGSTGCTGTPGGAIPITCKNANRNRVQLSGFNPALNVVAADLAAVFAKVDLANGGICHSSGPLCAAPFAAFGVDFESGLPSAAPQTVFRVE